MIGIFTRKRVPSGFKFSEDRHGIKWDSMGHEECEVVCAKARVNPELANQPWAKIDPRLRDKLKAEMTA